MPSLTLQLPGLPPVTHTLRQETITIGRMRGNTIVVDDNSVSLHHAKITLLDGKYFLKDLNSTNGTLLNGQSIAEAQLRENDQVAFADVKGHFSLEPGVPLENAGKPSIETKAPAALPPAFAPASALAGRSPSVAGFATLPAAPAVPLPGSTTSTAKRKRKAQTPKLVIFAGAAAALLIFCFAGIKGYQAWREKKLNDTAISSHTLAKGRVSVPAASPATHAPSVPPGNPRPDEASTNISSLIPESDSRVPQLAASLKSADVGERRRAAQSLHSLGEEAKPAEPELRAALSDADEEVQIWSALSLINNRVFERKIIPICVRALHHENPVLRQVVCLSLALFPYEEAERNIVIPALQAASDKDADEDVRKAAVSALSIIAPGAPSGETK